MISVIVPVLNGGDSFRRCMEALQSSHGVAWECVVVDDGSTDSSASLARAMGATVLETPKPRSGPGRARNLGAQVAKGDLLVFVDSDVLVQPDTLARFAAHFTADTELAACFGSYDDQPAAPNFLSQYKNLQHHFVHQQGNRAAHTFWAGCGAIRRDVFLQMGGFANDYARPSIEDIELGYRLRAAGHAIRMDPTLQVKHLKRWTAKRLLMTDIRDRALPWSRLIVQRNGLIDDLNVASGQRASGMLALAVAAGILTGFFHRAGWLLAAVAGGGLLLLNRRFYAFLARQRGAWFALRAMPWHWLYFIYSSLAFVIALLAHALPFSSTMDRPAETFERC